MSKKTNEEIAALLRAHLKAQAEEEIAYYSPDEFGFGLDYDGKIDLLWLANFINEACV